MLRRTRGRPDRRHGGTGARHTRRIVAPTSVAPGCKVKPAPGVTGPHRGTRTQKLRTSSYLQLRTGRTRQPRAQPVPTASHRPHLATSRQFWSFPAPARPVPGHFALVRVVPERPEGAGSTTTAAKSANHRGEDPGINHIRRERGQPPSEPQRGSCFLSFLVLPSGRKRETSREAPNLKPPARGCRPRLSAATWAPAPIRSTLDGCVNIQVGPARPSSISWNACCRR